MITAEKIKIYDRFGGDEDGIVLAGYPHEKAIFKNNDDWRLLMDFHQDIHFANANLASESYLRISFEKMRANCDDEAYNILIGRIV